MKRILFILFILLTLEHSGVAQRFENKVYDSNIKTLQCTLYGDELTEPVVRLGSEDVLELSFDLMSATPAYYSYSVIHCNADWTQSQLMEIEYMTGFNNNTIDDYSRSFNTTFDYIHYALSFPNENVKPLVSGNYVIRVFETDAPERTVLTAKLYVVEENMIKLRGGVSANTSHGVKREYQLLNFTLDCSKQPVGSPQDELKILVRQNGRQDNEVRGLLPTYVRGNELIFEDNRNLEFEGGCEFYRIDFSHIRNYSGRIERISFHHPYYNVEVSPGTLPQNDVYKYDKDVNGHFILHGQDIWTDLEIDYSVVHFTYPMEEPWLDGEVYVAGYFNDNKLDSKNKMVYNFERKQYELDIVLKNGGYNYQYLFLPSGKKSATTGRVSDSHWETENDYFVYVYYRPIGGRYDRLVNFSIVNSNNK